MPLVLAPPHWGDALMDCMVWAEFSRPGNPQSQGMIDALPR